MCLVKASDLLHGESLHGLVRHYFNIFGDVRFHFHDARWCNIIFLHQNFTKYRKKLLLQVLGRMSIHINWKHLKSTHAFSLFLVC